MSNITIKRMDANVERAVEPGDFFQWGIYIYLRPLTRSLDCPCVSGFERGGMGHSFDWYTNGSIKPRYVSPLEAAAWIARTGGEGATVEPKPKSGADFECGEVVFVRLCSSWELCQADDTGDFHSLVDGSHCKNLRAYGPNELFDPGRVEIRVERAPEGWEGKS